MYTSTERHISPFPTKRRQTCILSYAAHLTTVSVLAHDYNNIIIIGVVIHYQHHHRHRLRRRTTRLFIHVTLCPAPTRQTAACPGLQTSDASPPVPTNWQWVVF